MYKYTPTVLMYRNRQQIQGSHKSTPFVHTPLTHSTGYFMKYAVKAAKFTRASGVPS